LQLTPPRSAPIIRRLFFSGKSAGAKSRVANARTIAACCALAALLSAGPQPPLCAAVPDNPLRSATGNMEQDVWAEPTPQPLAQLLVAAEEPIAELPSVVPELLPPPRAESMLAVESLHDPAFDEGLYPGGLFAGGLVHPWLARPWFPHSDPNDPARHIGLGQPLIGTSWRNRPLYAGTFVGGILLGELQDNVEPNDTAFLGLRLGWDYDHYWGLEGRWAFARPELYGPGGAPLDDPGRGYFADVSLVYYPLGDARWRPYASVGLGFQTYRFINAADQRISEAAFSVPLGVGVKYFYGPWFSLRFDLVDNISFGNDRLNAMSNIGLMTGVEFRFGGSRQSYFPWHSNTSYW